MTPVGSGVSNPSTTLSPSSSTSSDAAVSVNVLEVSVAAKVTLVADSE